MQSQKIDFKIKSDENNNFAAFIAKTTRIEHIISGLSEFLPLFRPRVRIENQVNRYRLWSESLRALISVLTTIIEEMFDIDIEW